MFFSEINKYILKFFEKPTIYLRYSEQISLPQLMDLQGFCKIFFSKFEYYISNMLLNKVGSEYLLAYCLFKFSFVLVGRRDNMKN